MSSDNFEFSSSNAPQGMELNTPYISKQWNYIQDLNNGTYQNTGSCMATINATNIFSSDY